MINLINALRASHGLAPYTMEPDLMAMAQEHSTYQASIHTSTHQHSDGTLPPDLGVVENVAGGDVGFVDPEIVVYQIWVDAGHLKTMIGYESGSLGLGIADDGETVYYNLEVRPANTLPAIDSPAGADLTEIPSTPKALVPLVTMTPNSDGAIVHVVGYGQTLWAIALAYGVRVDQIRAWNNILTDSSDIIAGQRLLIRPPSLFSPTITITAIPTRDNTASVLSLGMPVDQRSIPSPVTLPASPNQTWQLSGMETQEGFEQSSTDSQLALGTSILMISVVSILVGCLLLIISLFMKKSG